MYRLIEATPVAVAQGNSKYRITVTRGSVFSYVIVGKSGSDIIDKYIDKNLIPQKMLEHISNWMSHGH